MANNQKEYQIIINGIEQSYKNVSSLSSALDALDKKVNSINSKGGVSGGRSASETNDTAIATEALTKAYSQNAVELAKIKNETREVNNINKAKATLDGTVIDSSNLMTESYNKLSAQYSLNKIYLNNMTAEERTSTEEGRKLEAETKAIHDRMKELQEATGNATLNVGNYTESINNSEVATKSLKSQIKEMQAEMAELTINGQKNSERYVELAQKAGEYKDALGDANDEIKHFASDTRGLDNIINIASTGIGVFETYQGVLAMTGADTKDYEETMQKLAGAMATLNGIQEVYNTLQDKSTAVGGAYQKIIQLITGEKTKETVATTAETVAEGKLSAAQKITATTSRALGIAMKTIPLMLIIGLVLELIMNWESIYNWFVRTFPIIGKLGGAFKTLTAVLKGVGAAIVQWVTNPIKTMANVIQKVIEGDFSGAVQAAMDGVKNQFTGLGKAFTQSFNKSIENANKEHLDKLRQQNLKAGKERLKDLEAQGKKDTTEYRNQLKKNLSLTKKGTEEYKEAQRELWRYDADARQKAANEAKKVSDKRLQVAKKAAEEEKKLIEEIAKSRKKVSDQANSEELNIFKKYSEIKYNTEKRQLEHQLELLKYKGPEQTYNNILQRLEELEKNHQKTLDGIVLNETNDRYSKLIEEEKGYTNKEKDLFKQTIDNLKNWDAQSRAILSNALTSGNSDGLTGSIKQAYDDIVKMFPKKELIDSIRNYLSDTIVTYNSYNAELLKIEDEFYDKFLETEKSFSKKNLDYIEAQLNNWLEKIKNLDVTSNTEFMLAKNKRTWREFFDFLNYSQQSYIMTLDRLIDEAEEQYGKDSKEYVDAIEKKKKALKEFMELQGKASVNSTSGSTDMNNDGKKDKEGKTLWDKDAKLLDNLAGVANTANEMIFQPMADTLSMYYDMVLEEIEDKLDEINDAYDEAVDKVEESEDKISDIQDEMENGSQGQTEALKEQLADEQLLYAQRAAKEQQLANEKAALEKKQKEEEKKARKNDMRANIAQAISNTAMGATKTLSEWSYPLSVIFAAIQTAFGLAQVGIMTAQLAKMQDGGVMKFANGGLVSGPSHSQGGVPVGNTGIEVEGGEFVINKKSTAKYFDLLNAINASGNGGKKVTADRQLRKFASGGELNYQQIDSDMRANNSQALMLNALSNLNLSPVVQVVDIEKGINNLTRVRSLAGKS